MSMVGLKIEPPPAIPMTKKQAIVLHLKSAGVIALDVGAPLYLVSLIRQCLHLAEKL